MTDFETCFDRDYECCDLTPPPDGLRYDEWYDAHVEAWKAHQSVTAGGPVAPLHSDDPGGAT